MTWKYPSFPQKPHVLLSQPRDYLEELDMWMKIARGLARCNGCQVSHNCHIWDVLHCTEQGQRRYVCTFFSFTVRMERHVVSKSNRWFSIEHDIYHNVKHVNFAGFPLGKESNLAWKRRRTEFSHARGWGVLTFVCLCLHWKQPLRLFLWVFLFAALCSGVSASSFVDIASSQVNW